MKVEIDIQFLQLQIREATEDVNRANLRLQALQSRMPQPENRMRAKGNWRVPLIKESKGVKR